MRYLLLIFLTGFLLSGVAVAQDEVSEEDLELIQMLEFLEIIDLIEDNDFELLEGLSEIGDDDDS